jgi:capsular exopolysaccharide synthesis family protein
MNSLYGQTSNPMMNVGMMPYGAPMGGMGGGDSLFQIAWKGKWLILLFALLGLGGGYGYYRFLMPQEYTSISRVLVEKPRSTGPINLLQPGTTATNYLQQQASILLSAEIIRAAQGDRKVRPLTFDPRKRLGRGFQTLSAKVGKDDIITVSASSDDPNEAAVVVNAVVGAYKAWHERNRESSTRELLADLQAQWDDRMKDLMNAWQDLVLLEQRNPGIVETAQGGIASKKVDALRQEVVTARMFNMQQESRYERLVNLGSDPNRFRQYVLSQGLAAESPERTRLAESLHKISLQLEELRDGGTVQKSQVTRLENMEKDLTQKIADLDKKFVQEQIAMAAYLKEDAKKREQDLTKLYEDQYAELQKAGGQNAAYELKKSECRVLESLCDTLLGKIKSLDINTRLEGLSIHVLEEAQEGRAPPSQTAKIMGIGLILGLMTGGGLAFLRDMKDLRVRSADEITAILGVPILGAVPTIPRRGLLRRGPRTRLSLNSRESEAYRSIRTALFFGSSNEEGKTLLVTSPGALEGKTTLVSNLGVAMAHAGQRTLIIDADLRKPMQHRVFARGGRGKGVIDVLSGAMTLDEAIRHTEIEGLDVLESGQPVPNPSELLSSDAFAALIEQVKGRYDRILVDSPPVGVVADAQILAARCGLTLLVLRAERSSRITTQRARDALSTVSAKVVGAVVNDVHKRDTRYSHYGYGAYSYYHSVHAAKGEPAVRKELPATVDQKPQGDSSAPAKKKKK